MESIFTGGIEAGNRTKGAAFSPKVWTILVTKFCDETGLNYDKDQLKSRWDVLKIDWRVWEQLNSHDTGLGWDAVKGKINASDDWWDRKLKEIPKAAKFRQKGPQNLEQLERMFRDVAATGIADRIEIQFLEENINSEAGSSYE
ncbi:L10-interacting MYB domain-containing protein-like [Quercus robur]|uniref:L10-interacting MYB domain-containing protein-like n=1 Tax=Quercus robur TaxID=38942 RepID=UPI0021623F9F|nr:L10-interacting MYB domain-containing protein-like [Quercus robur]